MKVPKLSKNAALVLVTVGIIGIAFVIYFLVIGESREKHFKNRAFYVLNHVGNNFNNRYIVFDKNVNELKDNIFGSDDSVKLDRIKKFKRNISRLNDDREANSDLINLYNDSLEQQIQFIINDLEDRINPLIQFEGHQFDGKKQALTHNQNNFYFYTNHQIDTLDFSLVFKCNQQSFINNIERKDIFCTFIIISDSSIIFQDEQYDFDFYELKNIEEQKFAVQKKINESIDSKNFKLFTVDPHTFSLNHSGNEYLGFIKHANMNFEGQWENLEFLGLVETSEYNRITKSIEPWIAIIMSLIVILIILGLPIIKLAIASLHEQIYVSNVVSMGISLFLGVSFISFTFFTLYSYYADREIFIDKKLKYFSATIQQSLNNELTKIFQQSDQYRNNVKKLNFYEWDVTSNRSSSFYPRYYKNFRYFNFLDQEGWNKASISTKQAFTEDTVEISYKNREYFKRIRDKSHWVYLLSKNALNNMLPAYERIDDYIFDCGNNCGFYHIHFNHEYFWKNKKPHHYATYDKTNYIKNIEYYLQSILSWTSGNAIAAVSTSADSKDALEVYKGNDTIPLNPLAYVLTTELYSIIDAFGTISKLVIG